MSISVNQAQILFISDNARMNTSSTSGEVYMLTDGVISTSEANVPAWQKRFLILSQTLLFYYDNRKVSSEVM